MFLRQVAPDGQMTHLKWYLLGDHTTNSVPCFSTISSCCRLKADTAGHMKALALQHNGNTTLITSVISYARY